MIRGHVFIAVSLDGCIARPDGGLDWLAMAELPGEDFGYQAFWQGIDSLVIGRRTYETARGFPVWPYDKPVVVMSRTLDPDDAGSQPGDVHVTAAAPEAIMTDLAARGWRNVYVDGGETIRSFLRAGLIDSLTLTRLPVLLGAGVGLFAGLEREIVVHHAETRSWPNGVVQSRYTIEPGQSSGT